MVYYYNKMHLSRSECCFCIVRALSVFSSVRALSVFSSDGFFAIDFALLLTEYVPLDDVVIPAVR
jgi:hypothetical protein